MVSQDLIYSVLPRQTGEVIQQRREIEKVVRRSSLKSVDENESSPQESQLQVREKRRGDRRSGDRRRGDRRKEPRQDPNVKADQTDDNQSEGLDIYV